jgi:checkpoint serine/threonine-protein kinase
VNPKTGREDYVFANLELVYPSGDAESGYEFCFEELRAMKRGLIDPAGRVVKPKNQRPAKAQSDRRPSTPPEREVVPKNTRVGSSRKLDIFHDTEPSNVPVKIPIFDDSEAPQPKQDATAKAAKKARKEEKANRTRKIAVMEVKAEPQTSKYHSPLQYQEYMLIPLQSKPILIHQQGRR